MNIFLVFHPPYSCYFLLLLIGRFYIRGRIFRVDELGQTFVVRLVMRLYYRDGNKTHPCGRTWANICGSPGYASLVWRREQDALSVWTNLGKHLWFAWLCVSSIETGTRRIIRLDELSCAGGI